MHKRIIYLIAFLSGALVMILELVGSRIISPYVGTSLFVWSSLISIILASLSIGYWAGGYLADIKTSPKVLSTILFLSSVSVFFIAIFKDYVLRFLQLLTSDIKIVSLLASIFLFAVPTILLGMVTPYVARLLIQTVKDSGKTVGRLYAISTIGSIAGTLFTGFFLISYFGSTSILFIIFLLLLFTSLLAGVGNFKLKALSIFILLLSFSLFYQTPKYFTTETDYNSASVIDTNSYTRILRLGSESHSGIDLASGGLVFDYTKKYDLISTLNPNFSKALMIGGGAYTYPMHYLRKYPKASIDVLEIDPKLTGIAKKYFGLKDNPRMKIINEDGRVYLNNTKEKYDGILIDAFLSYYSIPYHLTTKESVNLIYNALNDDGVVIVNVISSLEGKDSKFFVSEYKTYREVFPQVKAFPINPGSTETQNIMLIASKSKEPIFLKNEYVPSQKIVDNTPILTDDFAPVDQFISSFLF